MDITRQPSDTMAQRNGEFGPFAQEIMVIEVSQLRREGQVRAIQEWGLPESRLTHLVFCITSRSSSNMPGPDHHLTTLLRILHSFLHFEYQQGRFDERTAIRLFRDFARENHNDPVLVLLSEVTTPIFREVLRMTEVADRHNGNVRRPRLTHRERRQH